MLQAAPALAHVVVSDHAEGMVRRVQLGSPVVADAKRLPFRSQSFDAVVLAFVVQFIDEPDCMFVEIAPVLRPGRAVAVAAWGEVMKAPSERLWLEALDEFDAPLVPSVAAVAGKATVTLAELSEPLTRTGFGRVETRRLPWVEQPDVERFIRRMTDLGPSSRRTAAWDDRSRTLFCRDDAHQTQRTGPAGVRRSVRSTRSSRHRLSSKTPRWHFSDRRRRRLGFGRQAWLAMGWGRNDVDVGHLEQSRGMA